MGQTSGLLAGVREHANCGIGAIVELDGQRRHRVIDDALTVLERLDHRGARGADEQTGDGAGILIQKPHAFFRTMVPALPDADAYAVGQVFLPIDAARRRAFRHRLCAAINERGWHLLHWRDVPVDRVSAALGAAACATEPAVAQLFVTPKQFLKGVEFDRATYLLRRALEYAAGDAEFHICSLDRRILVYKGLLSNGQLRRYYPDLAEPALASAMAVVHSRFSTNTLGAWHLAQPLRLIAHNGEINSLSGNLAALNAAEPELGCVGFDFNDHGLSPLTVPGQSDSASLDNVLELMVRGGRRLTHALRMMIPAAWESDPALEGARRDWYDYHIGLMAPWDGPALVVACDGEQLCAVLDRNGLRPVRYVLTRDRRLILASEVGVLDIPPALVKQKGKLGAGQMLAADTRTQRLRLDDALFADFDHGKYGTWLRAQRYRLGPPSSRIWRVPDLEAWQRTFGYTREHLERLMAPMAAHGHDPIGAMGNDTPPAVLSTQPLDLFACFKQLFAQVSNPPIDYLREARVMSLARPIGRRRNALAESAEHARQLWLDSPILDEGQLDALKAVHGLAPRVLDATFPPTAGGLAAALERLRAKSEAAIAHGCECLVLSDAGAGSGRVPIPALVAVGALHHHLLRRGLRSRVALVVETGASALVHPMCLLLGYGADAVSPYLTFASVRALVAQGRVSGPAEDALGHYRRALETGIRQVMAKMGISVLASYHGAQLFEAIGLSKSLVDTCFSGTVSRLGGIGLEEIEAQALRRHRMAFMPALRGALSLPSGGEWYWRRDGEAHQWEPETIALLQRAARFNDATAYRQFADRVDSPGAHLGNLRGLLGFNADAAEPVPIDEVEPVAEIVRRFFTSAMSFGALSLEAHETLAIAMHRLGGKASSGEGGEQTERFDTERGCAIKQVSTARFGVTSHYLAQASDIEIKMAQGSKPGEGGHLPGAKVDQAIAGVRHTVPGVSLISPPPHHDIYSIEDLAQLIHDLKCTNEAADIHVKLVAKSGVGTIAAGVAKARADAILITGDEGGTGASPKSSIKHAGLPWELGLAETQQALLATGLRSRVLLRLDGGLKTGRDVAIGALLGAEAFGFGTAALVTLGCVMLRKCHCNTCSVGIATQDPILRSRFAGQPEHLMNYLRFVAQHLREVMATLGFRRLDEMVGRADRLKPRRVLHSYARHLDMGPLLYRPPGDEPPRRTRRQHHDLARQIDRVLIRESAAALRDAEPVRLAHVIGNGDRSVGAMLSGAVSRRWGAGGLPDATITVDWTGSAGQSFGAFLARGVDFRLTGDANDYVGKGLSGGRIALRPPPALQAGAERHVIAGNVIGFGATAGELYLCGRAGDRLAVRNAGAFAVVEGIGAHGCEYMTGGAVLVLGEIGPNFAAGMSGGEAFLLDGALYADRINSELVDVAALTSEHDIALLERLLRNHRAYTGSRQAAHCLAHWTQTVSRLIKVVPHAYARALDEARARGQDLRPRLPDPVGARVSSTGSGLSEVSLS